MPAFRCEDSGMIILSPRKTRDDVSGKKSVAERVAVVSFVRAYSLRKSDVNAVNRANC